MSISKKRTFFFWSFWGKIRTMEEGWSSLVWYLVCKFQFSCLQNGPKKGAFFWDEPAKFGKFRPILGDESRCVFPIFLKKKRTPIRHSKSQKVRFFHDFEKKNVCKLQRWMILEFTYMKLFFQNHEKNAPFGILSDELGCVFFWWILKKRTSIRHLKSA